MKKLLVSILGIVPILGIFTVNADEYPSEMVDAYHRAYENGIISESSIEDANLYDALSNSSIKKILLNYANYLGLDSNLATTLFGDLFNDEDSNTNRAIFGTALSRILWGNKYDGGTPYYKKHLNALKTTGIMNQIDNPESRNEIKGYVLSMLKNSVSEYEPRNEETTQESTKIAEQTKPEISKTPEIAQDDTKNVITEKDNTTTPIQVYTYKNREQSNGNPSDILQNGYTREMNNAYNFAHTNGITTTNNIEKAKMNSPLTRIAMAKMLSYYAINILGQKPNTSKTIIFNDITEKQNSDYNNAVTLAYQLGIMGQNMKNNNFRPNDEVTRAEFATALSRMLYNTEDGKGNIKYYEPHITKLNNAGIINNTNPQLKEKRGYVMLMLMRSIK